MRVLLIEDDSATAQSIELMLRSEGFNVFTTELGEDGVEIILGANMVSMAMKLLMKNTDDGQASMTPAGLGCRDSLRLEAGMPLYGQEINLEIDPLEAGLGFGVDFTKDDTLGVPALRARKEAGLKRTAVSLAQTGGRVARTGHKVMRDGQDIGVVTSGGVSPTVERNIARAIVDASAAEIGSTLDIEIRGRTHPMEVVAHPFYKRPR